jgi:Xaa-Pro aminopeptidase
VSVDRREERLAALQRRLAAEGLDALVVAALPNIRYLTGFSGSSGLLLVTATAALFLSDFRYRDQARREIGDLARVSTEGAGAWERLLELVKEYPGLRRIGFEAHVVTARQAERLRGNGVRPWEFVAAGELVEALRVVKAPEEVAAIRAAGALATDALARALATVRAGQTELEIAGNLERALRRGGSEWYAFPTIAAAGPGSASPHARTSGRVVAPGDLLLLDFGAVVDGYCCDLTRTVVVGAAPMGEQRERHEVVRRAQAAALTGLRAGMTGRQADALAREVIDAAGLGEAFGHSLGHGLGLEVHEAPRLAKTSEEPLPASAVVTVEPGIYLDGWGGIRIEDDVVLGPGGAELLTDFPRDLLRVG